MKNKIINIVSWLIVLWTAKVFLFSLPYKFTGHPDTQHIFGTIGTWMQGILGNKFGALFGQYGAYAVGSVELLTSLVLLSPILFFALKKARLVAAVPPTAVIHALGGLMAAGVMAGAVFFHLFTPLGIEVIHHGQSDNGSLFYAAVSILIWSITLFALNFLSCKASDTGTSTV
ncbi:MAG: hypothetical protein JKX83_06450 [Pseudomonadales bacterium]|nr:hypothetical protein [Pseudomonadales bacterium]